MTFGFWTWVLGKLNFRLTAATAKLTLTVKIRAPAATFSYILDADV